MKEIKINDDGNHGTGAGAAVAAGSSFILHPSSFRKYSRIFRVSLIERLHYRGDFFFSTILRFLPMLTTILLWRAVYIGAKETTGETELAGYGYLAAARAEFLARLGRIHDARTAYEEALLLTENSIERDYLAHRLDQLQA